MYPETRAAIECCIAAATNEPAEVVSQTETHGGCINSTDIIKLSDGRRFFVKTNSNAPVDLFEREADGLNALAAADTIRVPSVIGLGESDGTLFLILEAIESSKRTRKFFEVFGQQLAQLHQASVGDRFGFSISNYLGSTIQPNDWADDWIGFWREHRLGFQFGLARRNGYFDDGFDSLADRLLSRLDSILTTVEPPVLIHGDLWSGNYLTGTNGEPVLIDPAAYFGHREAEFGMTTLFGGFDEKFYEAYQEVWPLNAGSVERIEIYRLYHLLNHLNLFGNSYRAACVEIMKKYA